MCPHATRVRIGLLFRGSTNLFRRPHPNVELDVKYRSWLQISIALKQEPHKEPHTVLVQRPHAGTDTMSLRHRDSSL